MASFIHPVLHLPSPTARSKDSRRVHLKLVAAMALLSDVLVEAWQLRAELLKRYPHLRNG